MNNHHQARKRFGQHFLINQAVIAEIIATINPKVDDTVIEIGPGLGALTKQLLPRLKQLSVIELDRDLINNLRDLTSAEHQIQVYHQDALKFDFNKLYDGRNKLRIIGNLPYNISTPLLFHLIDYAEIIDDMVFMLQKEVVERITADVGTHAYGRLSVMLQYYLEADYLFTVEPESFDPPPKVRSAVLRLSPHQQPRPKAEDVIVFANIVNLAFSHRRKQLRNCLKTVLTAEELTALGIDPQQRPEQLTISQYIKIADYVSAVKLVAGPDN